MSGVELPDIEDKNETALTAVVGAGLVALGIAMGLLWARGRLVGLSAKRSQPWLLDHAAIFGRWAAAAIAVFAIAMLAAIIAEVYLDD